MKITTDAATAIFSGKSRHKIHFLPKSCVTTFLPVAYNPANILEGMIVYRQTLHWLEVKLPLVSFRTQGLFDTLGKEVSSNI
jgi:hypothetical protein